MRIWRLAALSLAAVLTAGMLTGCPWDKEASETDDASSVPAASSSTSRPSSDEDDTSAPPAKHTVTIKKCSSPAFSMMMERLKVLQVL